MKIVSLSYARTTGFHDPESWLQRVKPYGLVLEALAKKHSVISIEQIEYEGQHSINGVEYYFIHVKNLRIPSTLHQLVKKINPEVVIVHGLNHPLQMIQLRKALGKNIKLLAQSHAEKIPTGWRKWIQRSADRYVDAYLFTSLDMATKWLDKKLIAQKEKIKEVMVGASTFKPMDASSAKSITQTKGEPVFLFVGRVDDNKDPITLIKGFALHLASHPTATLYIIFQNEEKRVELESVIKQLSVQDRIHLLGKLAHNDLQAWYSSVDFIVSTSHAEAFGMAVAEAMSCGCFPIVTNIPSFRKLTDNGNFGILFEPGDAGQLAAALGKAGKLNLDIERKKILAHYSNHLSAEAIAEQIYKAANSF